MTWARRHVGYLLLVAVVLVSAWRTEAALTRAEKQSGRLVVAERQIRQIIEASQLDCPNRAKARGVLRAVLLADPDLSAELRALVDADFKPIPCN